MFQIDTILLFTRREAEVHCKISRHKAFRREYYVSDKLEYLSQTFHSSHQNKQSLHARATTTFPGILITTPMHGHSAGQSQISLFILMSNHR